MAGSVPLHVKRKQRECECIYVGDSEECEQPCAPLRVSMSIRQLQPRTPDREPPRPAQPPAVVGRQLRPGSGALADLRWDD